MAYILKTYQPRTPRPADEMRRYVQLIVLVRMAHRVTGRPYGEVLSLALRDHSKAAGRVC